MSTTGISSPSSGNKCAKTPLPVTRKSRFTRNEIASEKYEVRVTEPVQNSHAIFSVSEKSKSERFIDTMATKTSQSESPEPRNESNLEGENGTNIRFQFISMYFIISNINLMCLDIHSYCIIP